MNELSSIFIERNSCGDCYRCARECAVKAIKFHNTKAEIIPSMCVECGNCVTICPVEAIKVRDDIWVTRRYIKNYDVKIASLAPSWVTEFPGVEAHRMVEALKLLGFTHVSESAFGAESLFDKEVEYMRNHRKLHISSRCPAIVEYIRKYRPKLTENLIPYCSPMLAHARMIKEWWGKDAKVVYISECIAAKQEAEANPDLVDIALTFKELKQWMYDEGVEFDFIPGQGTYHFDPFKANKNGLLYPLLQGDITERTMKDNDIKLISKSGLTEVDKFLYYLPQNINNETIYLNLMACDGGCINSAGSIFHDKSMVDKELSLLKEYEKCSKEKIPYTLPNINVSVKHEKIDTSSTFVAEVDTIAALNSIGIYTELDQINCNGCGYVTCRRFAKAISRGMASRSMCIPYLKREFKDKFTVLLQRMPSGIMVVNDKLKIVEANRNMAAMLGADIEMVFDANPGMEGADITKIISFHKMFSAILESGEDSIERDVQIKDRMVKVSIYTIQKNMVVMAIVRNLFISQVRNEEVINRTQQVIKDNMATVQKIAYLLGENASRTEAVLNTILDSQQSSSDAEQG